MAILGNRRRSVDPMHNLVYLREEVLEEEEQDPASSPHGNYGSDTGSIHDAVAAAFVEPSDTSDTDTWPPASPPEGQVSDEGGGEPSSDDDEWEDA